MNGFVISPVAYIKNDFTEKFGVPRQSGLCNIKSEIVFTDEFKDENYIREIEQYSHLWLIWRFSENEGFSPTVRPPKLGGNKRVGVFATRSSFRPNSLGLSVVKLEKVQKGSLLVSGADLKNNTPIYDIKPYLPYADSIPNALGGFSEAHKAERKEIIFLNNTENKLNSSLKADITEMLSLDPRPAYQEDENRVYGVSFGGYNIKFNYRDNKICVTEVENADK